MRYRSSSIPQDVVTEGNQPQGLFSAALAIFFLGFLIAVPFRVYQLITAVDATTGFYTSQNLGFSLSNPVLLFNGLMLLLAVLLLLLPLFQREMSVFADPEKSTVLLGIGLLVAGLAVTYLSVTEVLHRGGNTQRLQASFWISVLGAVSGFLLILTGFRMFSRRFFSQASGLYLLVIPAWSCIRLLREFMSSNTVSGVSERILDIITSCGGTMTLFCLVALLCGVNTKSFHRLLVSSALVTALFGLVANLPRILIQILGNEDLKQVMLGVHLSNLGLAVMSLLILIWYLTIARREKDLRFHPREIDAEEKPLPPQDDWSKMETLISQEEEIPVEDIPEPEPAEEVIAAPLVEEVILPAAPEPEEPPAPAEATQEPVPEKQSEPQMDERGYTILPSLADLDGKEMIEWDLDENE